MRVVLDTNVIVSALLSPTGVPARVLDCTLRGIGPDGEKIRPCYDSRIIFEYEIVLLRPKFRFDENRIRKLIRIFSASGISIVAERSDIPLPDESDRKFYDVARSAGALLVTGNKRHFPAEPFILTPNEFFNA